MTCRSIAAECSAGSAAKVARVTQRSRALVSGGCDLSTGTIAGMIPTRVRPEVGRHVRSRTVTPIAVALVLALLTVVPVTTETMPASQTTTTVPAMTRPSYLTPSTPPAGIDERAPELGFVRRSELDEARARLAQPTAAAEAAAAKPKAESKGPIGRIRARGDATWYCLAGRSSCHYARSGGMYAAAGPALRVGDWRGRKVTVCAGSDCVRVTLIDWCACGDGRVIDLYSDAFRRLASLGTGEIRVAVRW